MERISQIRTTKAVFIFVGSLAMVLGSGWIVSAGAAASSAKSSAAAATPKTSVFCQYAQNADKNTSPPKVTTTPTSLLAAFKELKTEEPEVLSKAPSQIKGDFVTVFNYINGLYAELAKYQYDYIKLPPSYLLSLGTLAKKVEPASEAIAAYMTKTCGVKA